MPPPSLAHRLQKGISLLCLSGNFHFETEPLQPSISTRHLFNMKRILLVSLAVFCSTVIISQDNDPDIKLRAVDIEGTLKLRAINLTYGFIDLYIKNLETDLIEQRFAISPLDSTIFWILGTGKRDSLVSDFNKVYDVGYFLGGDLSMAAREEKYLYALPYQVGKKYPVSQGANGKFSHSGPISQYAIDFQLEIGEQVHAAREGRVIKVVENFNESGGRELLWKANRIVVLHSDGTTASYVHLDYDGSLVEEGDYVERGQHIGYSGNTGFTRGPHLHFVVRKERDLSIPVYFEGYEGVELKKRKKYKRR